MEDIETYGFRFATAHRLAALAFGITPSRTAVTLTRDTLDVRFGPWRLTTPLGNVRAVELSGPYGFLKTAGPAHLSLVDGGITFAVNADAGLCIRFDDSVPVTYPGPLPNRRHTAVTVTVADPHGLAGRLA